ncbi:hypothetical protein PQC65_gp110 [Aeromonas phage pAEv1810]|uniref:hypothetical protein n=1 Tax=Aeromonas phage pAEv1810 TaxID=2908744 RepID=UPI0023291CDC|nr:hypothetical protein PQC65_gp110 [Aeromonas phage pAEv1810]UIS25048.1 hypothetical protein pAEv1810_110 [Aeromonas phage pAEv1810]
MLGIEFIRKEHDFGYSLAGMEFMDFQKQDRYLKLVEFFKPLIKNMDGAITIDWIKSEQDDLVKLIMEIAGIKVKVVEYQGYEGNLGIDAGYLSPNAVLNNKGIDDFVDAKHTKVSQAFRSLNADVLKGWVDQKTGMIGGDFSKIEFDLYIQTYVDMFINTDKLKKLGVPPENALAGFIVHELGHVWTAFYTVWRNVSDMMMQNNAIRMLGRTEGQREQIEIYKETLKVLEADAKVDDKIVSALDTDEARKAFFDKAISNRDLRRTLSVGTADRASEVMADMYAIKMGCPKDLVTGLVSLHGSEGMGPSSLVFSVFMLSASLLVSYPLGIGLWGVITTLNFHGILASKLAPDYLYDSNYRRIKTILRECVTEFSQNKKMKPADKQQFLAKCKEIEKLVEENKPILEGTAFQRYIGWICSGTDFKAQEFEHYTAELVSHNLALYTDYFKES